MLQAVAVIQDAVRRDSDPVLPQFLYRFAFHHISQEKVDVSPDIRLFCHNFLCKGALLCLVPILHDLLRVQNGRTVIFLSVHPLVDVHGFPGISRFHHKQQLIAAQIAFDRVVPPLILNIQKVCEYLYVDEFPASLVKTVAQFVSGLFQFPGIRLLPLLQFL